MNALLLRNLQMRRASSLQSFREYRALEAQNPQQSSVTSDGALLEFETLELRLHPPNVVIDNDSYDDMTVITIDSANRPGTLIEVVQCLTELNLSIKKARISSDGGWFVDEFFVTETPKGKVLHQHKLELIRKVLSVGSDPSFAQTHNEPVAVFELAGRDQRGLLASVLTAMVNSGCDVQSLAVWTYHNQVALVMAVADRSHPPHTSRLAPPAAPALARPGSVPGSLSSAPGHHAHEPDPAKMAHLTSVLSGMLGGEGAAHVAWEVALGDVHHERRLHHLLLAEEERCWEAQLLSSASSLAASQSLSTSTPQLLPSNSLLVAQGQTPSSRHTSQSGVPPPGPNLLFPSDSVDASPAGATPVANGTGPESLTASSSFVTVQHQQGHLEGGLVEAHQNGGDASDASRNRVLLSGSGSGSLPPTYLPAPTAMPASDFLNLQTYLDPASAAHLLRAEVRIQHSPLLKYYLVTITCKDRNKLFFDTVCTLADMQYDVYHGAIDSEADQASQLFYVRPRSGELFLDDTRVRQLTYMLECAVQRRFPRGLRMHLQTTDRKSVPSIFSALCNAGLSVTRAEVRTLTDGRAIFDLTLTDGLGQVPSGAAVQRVCEAAGGVQADELDPLMAVAGVGGAAAAAATALRATGLPNPGPPGLYGMATQLHTQLPSGIGGGRHVHSVSAIQGASGAASLLGPQGGGRYLPGKFQFAIPCSMDRSKRGPMSTTASSISGT